MGSSAKRKKEKKKDFQKAKLKVGKARPKAENQTDTSFRAKAIVLNQQSLTVSAPDGTYQFHHHVSLLASRSDAQRKESLAYLTTFVSTYPVAMSLPMPTGGLLDKVLPLLLDGSGPVRSQALKLMQALRNDHLRDHVSKLLPFIRAGMTHLSRDIRSSAIDFLAWTISVAGEEVVSCAGGWYKTLESFITLLSWKTHGDMTAWSSSRASFGSDNKATARVMQVLDHFLKVGLEQIDENRTQRDNLMAADFPIWFADANRIPMKSDAFASLNLYGNTMADGNQILDDCDDRIQVFNAHFKPTIIMGVAAARNEGGELGRAAGLLTKTLKQTDVEV